MQRFVAAVDNVLIFDLVAKESGSAISSGTVNFYLVADSGSNQGKWWNASTKTWSATKVSAGVGTYKDGSTWRVTVDADAWVTRTHYIVYAETAAGTHIPYSEKVVELEYSTGVGTVVVTDTYGGGDYRYLTSAGIGIENALVYAFLSSDYSADNVGSAYIKAQTTTTSTGEWNSPLNLDPGTYTLYYYKANAYGPDITTLEVS